MFSSSIYSDGEITLDAILSIINDPNFAFLPELAGGKAEIVYDEPNGKQRLIKNVDHGFVSIEVSEDHRMIEFLGVFTLQQPQDLINNLKIVNELNLTSIMVKYSIWDKLLTIGYALTSSGGVTNLQILTAYRGVVGSASDIFKEKKFFLDPR